MIVLNENNYSTQHLSLYSISPNSRPKFNYFAVYFSWSLYLISIYALIWPWPLRCPDLTLDLALKLPWLCPAPVTAMGLILPWPCPVPGLEPAPSPGPALARSLALLWRLKCLHALCGQISLIGQNTTQITRVTCSPFIFRHNHTIGHVITRKHFLALKLLV